ncbi:MAG: cytochrome c oxidase assembly protein, partial [Alphaproteobacteria bacterium]|nr:cytochrome c oxidase assembly protein [Alphaproteobacteria bacterium]
GTTMLADVAPTTELDRPMTVKFNASTAPDLPWNFRAEQREVRMNVGKKTLVNFRAENYAGAPVTGTAVYNVTPPKAGKYFHKMECFCFGEQLLTPGQKMDMPVVFFVDPAIADDPNMDDVTTITLSYSFFRTESERLEQALEDFYNQPAASAGKAGGGS